MSKKLIMLKTSCRWTFLSPKMIHFQGLFFQRAQSMRFVLSQFIPASHCVRTVQLWPAVLITEPSSPSCGGASPDLHQACQRASGLSTDWGSHVTDTCGWNETPREGLWINLTIYCSHSYFFLTVSLPVFTWRLHLIVLIDPVTHDCLSFIG